MDAGLIFVVREDDTSKHSGRMPALISAITEGG